MFKNNCFRNRLQRYTLFIKQPQEREKKRKKEKTARHRKNNESQSSYLGRRILHFDFNLHTTREFKFHQGVDSLGSRTVNINQTLVV